MHTGEISDNSKVVLKRKQTANGPLFIYKKWKLTGREVQILLLIALRYTSIQMAEKLFICKKTIDYHRRGLKKKLGVKTTLELFLAAIEFAEYINKENFNAGSKN